MGVLGFYQGKVIDVTQPVVPLEDRGHQFGDGVYEVVVSYRGKLFALQEHLERLERSCREIRLTPIYSREELFRICDLLIEKSQIAEAMIYMQWTRGIAPRSHSFPSNTQAEFSATIRPRKVLSPELFDQGVKSIFLPDERWLRCDIKSLNLLGSVLAKQKAVEAGCFEAILIRDNKIVTEGSSCNCFAVQDGCLVTSPADNLILSGVTRNKVIQLARDLGYTVREEHVSPQFYQQAQEVFLTGTTIEVMPVTVLNGKPVYDGQVGPVTRRLQEAYFNFIGKV